MKKLLHNLRMSAFALLAVVVCGSVLGSCSKDEDNLRPPTPPTPTPEVVRVDNRVLISLQDAMGANLFLQEANRSALSVYRLESGSNAPFQWNSTSGAMTVSMDNPTLGAPLSVFIVSYGGHDLQGSCSYQTLTSPQGDSKAMRITSVTIGDVTVALSGRQDPFTDLVTIPLRYTGSTLEVVR